MVSQYEDITQTHLDNLKEQHKEALHNYGAQVAELDKEIKELKKIKKTLVEEINILTQSKDNAESEAKKEKAKEVKLIQDSLNDVKEQLAEIEQQKKDLDILEKTLKDNHEKALTIANKKDSDATAKITEYNKKLKELSSMESDTEAIQGELESALKQAKDEKNKYQGLIDKLADKKAIAEQLIDENTKAIQENKKLKSEYEDLIREAKDTNAKILQEEEDIKSKLVNLQEAKDAFEKEKEGLLEGLKKQSKDNEFRSQELDVGYEKLANDQAFIRRESKRLEALREEINKLRKEQKG